MSRSFNANTANYMTLGASSPLGALINGASGASIHAFVNLAALPTGGAAPVVVVGWLVGNITGVGLGIVESAGSVYIRGLGRSRSADALQLKVGTTALSTGVLYSVGVVFDFGAATITPYLAGVAEGGGSVTFGSATFTNAAASESDQIGSGTNIPPASATSMINGDISEVSLWKVALTANEMASVARGISPLAVRPTSLSAYFPLYGQVAAGPERCLVGSGITGTITGTLSAGAAHAPVQPGWHARRGRTRAFLTGHPASRRLGGIRHGRPVAIGAQQVRVF